MNTIIPLAPQQIIHQIIHGDEDFPNNSLYPLLIYKQVLNLTHHSPEEVEEFLKNNGWKKSWINGIYNFHHYHSNTHEVLVIVAGTCTVQMGGNKGDKFDISKGDVVVIPAGVSHKNVGSSADFKCVGAYPFSVDYDMNYGKSEEFEQAEKKIKKVGLPSMDPIFGKNGPLFHYWK